MAYAPHLRVTVGGIFGSVANPAEEWSFGFQLGHPSGAAIDLGDPLAFQDMTETVQAWFTSSATRIATTCRLASLKMAQIDSAGHVVKNPDGSFSQRVHSYGTTDMPVGSQSSPLHPFQVAAVASLVTPRAGRSGRGRCYLPAPAVTVSAGGTISTTDRDSMLNTFAIMLNSVNADIGPAVRVVVASNAGVNSPVVAVRMGLVLDTQRRRRGELDEAYAIQTLAVG